MSKQQGSELDRIIPPEIKDDAFYNAIRHLAREESLTHILEIGSSAGGGSTEAFVLGLRENPAPATLHCVEVSRERARVLRERYQSDPFVQCHHTSSVDLSGFASSQQVREFYHSIPSTLNQYPLEQVLAWLQQDIDYVNEHAIPEDGIAKIKAQYGIEHFDLVLIDGSEFTGEAELKAVYGARYLLLDDVNAFKNRINYDRLKQDEQYELLAENWQTRNGFAIFRRKAATSDSAREPSASQTAARGKQIDHDQTTLPIHFFTIVLNGEPFIREHMARFEQLQCDWHWHIVEGVAELKHDTAWSVAQGGCIPDDLHDQGRSVDGTSAYLDELAQRYPEKVTLYRKPLGEFWDGKLEMVAAPLANIHEPSLLWQVDVDELWQPAQIMRMREMFLQQADKTAAFFWCHYFVGPDRVVTTRNCYSQNPSFEWLRVWRFQPGMQWAAHEPPTLAQSDANGQWQNVAAINPFMHDETEANGLVFEHYAYVLPEQLLFKEQYYGYKEALDQWLQLQSAKLPVRLGDYFQWVEDDTQVGAADTLCITPSLGNLKPFTLAVDGVFFAMNDSGIARVWKSLFEVWSRQGLGRYISVLDYNATSPRFDGIQYSVATAYHGPGEANRRMLQDWCDQCGADVFMSTYYSLPLHTPSVLMVHDMIPEVLDWDMSAPVWAEKNQAIEYASAYLTVSENTAKDLLRFHPQINKDAVSVATNGLSSIFNPATDEELEAFKQRHGITKPYFMVSGRRELYKNVIQFFQAMAQLPERDQFEVICTGGAPELEPELAQCCDGFVARVIRLDTDADLRAAYSGAVALVYPSLYEGFGLPVLEAMACDTPVITCPYASLPEVAGDAALYVDAHDIPQMMQALQYVCDPGIRQAMIEAGRERVGLFSWEKMAARVLARCVRTAVECRDHQAQTDADPLRHGEELFEQGEFEKACMYFEQAVQEQTSAAAHNDLGVCYWHLGRDADALAQFQQGLQLAPADPDLMENLAALAQQHMGSEEPEKAASAHPEHSQMRRAPESEHTSSAVVPKSKKPVRISALVSTYASEAFMQECLEDLESQTVADQLEIIIIDANSPENEGAIVKEFQQRYDNIRYIRTQERIGIYAAWNMAAREAQGEYLISCSTNDRLKDDACEKLMQALDFSPDVALVYGNSYLTTLPHETFEDNHIYDTYVWPTYNFLDHIIKPTVGPHAMWRRCLHDELGYFDESYIAIGDQEFWLRIGERYPLKHIHHFTTLHWVTDDSLSGNRDVATVETERALNKYQRRFQYREWQKLHSLEEIHGELMAERMVKLWKTKPRVNLITVLRHGDEVALADSIDSLSRQFYQNWHLTVLSETPPPDDAYESSDMLSWCQVKTDVQLLEEIKDQLHKDGDGWVAILRPGVMLEPHCLNSLIDYQHIKSNWKLVYTDNDTAETQECQQPCFKPDFNLEYLRSYDYIGGFWFLRQDVARQLDWQALNEYSLLNEVVFRVYEQYGDKVIGHISNVLYHERQDNIYHEVNNHEQHVRDHLQRLGLKAKVSEGLSDKTLMCQYLHVEQPLVSIVIPTRDKYDLIYDCIESLFAKTDYPAFEVLIVDHNSQDHDVVDYFETLRSSERPIQILHYEGEFNFADMCNRAVDQAKGDYIVLLNNDTQIIQSAWLTRLMAHAQRDDIGAVGAKLVYPETGVIQHAGVILGMGGHVDHVFRDSFYLKDDGYMKRNQCVLEMSAVTGACMVVRKSVYQQTGGMDGIDLKASFNDVDLCLKIREAGYKVIWTPYSIVVHHGGASQLSYRSNADDRKLYTEQYLHEIDTLFARWKDWIKGDPAYNRHLCLSDTGMNVEAGAIINWDPNFHERPRILGVPLSGASGEYRVRAPLRAVSRAGMAETDVTHTFKLHDQRVLSLPEVLRADADVLLCHATISEAQLNNFKLYRKHHDAKIIFTMDDLITNLPEYNNFKKHIPRDARRRLREALSHSDSAIVTTEPLRVLIEDMIDDIHMVPNFLERGLWGGLESRRAAGPKPRVGWAGAQQHGGDLAFLEEVVKATAQEVDWIFFGMCPERLKPYVHEEHAFILKYEDYPAKLASLNLDLAVAPLAIHPFNECKSNLRLLEYGFMGWPVICSDIVPYQQGPVTRLPNDSRIWVEAIRAHINDLDAAYAMGDALQEWVLRRFILEEHVDIWRDALLGPQSALKRVAGSN